MTLPVGGNDADIAEPEFLNELRFQFDREEDFRKSLDKKSSTMITISSIIFTILSLIGSFIINSSKTSIHHSNWSFINSSNLFYILIIGIFLAIISIILFAISYGIKKYHYPVGAKHFFEKDGKTTKEKINEYRYSTKKSLLEI